MTAEDDIQTVLLILFLAAHLIYDGTLHGFDGDRGFIDPQDTTALTRGRAHSASELREVVGLQQAVQGFLPPALVHQVIPLWNQVAQRTPCNQCNIALHILFKMTTYFGTDQNRRTVSSTCV